MKAFDAAKAEGKSSQDAHKAAREASRAANPNDKRVQEGFAKEKSTPSYGQHDHPSDEATNLIQAHLQKSNAAARKLAKVRLARSPKPNHDFSGDSWTASAKEGQRVRVNPKVAGGGSHHTIESFGQDRRFVVTKDAAGKRHSFNASDLSPQD